MPGQIIPVEGRVDPALVALDRYCGIDYLHVNAKNEVKGIGTRVQSCSSSFDTFTIRHERASGVRTEFGKRKSDIRQHGLFPVFTLQAFVSKRQDLHAPPELLAFAIARTSDLMDLIDQGLSSLEMTGPNQIGQAKFHVIGWSKVVASGVQVVIYDKDKGLSAYPVSNAETGLPEDIEPEVTEAEATAYAMSGRLYR